jgi:manganese/zinc/iron transport system permease protein
MGTFAMLSIILTGALVAGAGGLVGSFLVLRRLAFLGDAISHAVLPGIVIAWLVSGSRSTPAMVLGAGVLGLLTTFLVQAFRRSGVQEDAAIGVSFTGLFALGVLLVSLFAGSVDLDLDCVLYGEIAYTPWDPLIIGGLNLGPESLWTMGTIFLINLTVILLFYKQFKICAFDPDAAAAAGINVPFFHYLLMGLVSLTTIGSFESVGSILVVAMLIVPPATAYLLTEKLHVMLGLSVLIGAVSSVLGYFLARSIDGSITAAMTTVAGALFLLAFLFAPQQGLVSRWLARRRLAAQAEV